MKYLRQAGIILLISFLGEAVGAVLPLPVPASIYGLVLMFLCLRTGVLPVSAVRDTALFLIEIMPVMFIPAAVGLLESWNVIRPVLAPYAAITVITTVVVMVAAGRVTQAVLRRGKKEGEQ